MAKKRPKRVRIRIAGPDKKGIIATVTQFVFQAGGNIEDIDQRNLEGYLVMNMLVDLSDYRASLQKFCQALAGVAQKIGMESSVKEESSREKKNLAILVTKESHCLQDILKQIKAGKINAEIKMVVGNQPGLESFIKKYSLPFRYIPSEKKKWHEEEILKLLQPLDIDLIVLARYMQILSPEFVFRYEGKIINIHPSLLPAFPGPRSYEQAYNKGVDFAGVTAHFVTTDLDEGPIICQEAFRLRRGKEDPISIQERGRKLETKALTQAVKWFCDDQLVLRRGRVIFSKHEHAMTEITRQFYQFP
ncbi:MAG: formyltetrahydrofolate deformylase [Deltaproteobacteria bacterium]|nr:formyltetrahydrofolate deformylase [Deltaproteobacteria bacterium]